MSNLNWERITTKAPYVARKVAREFPGVEADDISQEIYLYLAENTGSISATTETAAGLEALMTRAARAYATRERNTYLAYSAEWIYTPAEVRALFEEAFFDATAWESAPVKDEGLTISAKGIVVCLWDLANAYESLTPDDRAVIHKRYNTVDNAFTDAEQKRFERAIDKVTTRINGRMAAKSETRTVSAATI